VDTAEGAAARAGLRENDVILSVNNTEVANAKQFESVVAKLDKAKPVTMLVRRGELVSYLVIRPGR
jgi:serine protease Do